MQKEQLMSTPVVMHIKKIVFDNQLVKQNQLTDLNIKTVMITAFTDAEIAAIDAFKALDGGELKNMLSYFNIIYRPGANVPEEEYIRVLKMTKVCIDNSLYSNVILDIDELLKYSNSL